MSRRKQDTGTYQILFSPRLSKQPDSGVLVTEQKVALLS